MSFAVGVVLAKCVILSPAIRKRWHFLIQTVLKIPEGLAPNGRGFFVATARLCFRDGVRC